jgi:hypothetical protein
MSPFNDTGSRKSTSSDITKRELTTATSADDVSTAHLGVKTVEATHKVYGKYSKWALFIGYFHRSILHVVLSQLAL